MRRKRIGGGAAPVLPSVAPAMHARSLRCVGRMGFSLKQGAMRSESPRQRAARGHAMKYTP